jgi:hypothetical protein
MVAAARNRGKQRFMGKTGGLEESGSGKRREHYVDEEVDFPSGTMHSGRGRPRIPAGGL